VTYSANLQYVIPAQIRLDGWQVFLNGVPDGGLTVGHDNSVGGLSNFLELLWQRGGKTPHEFGHACVCVSGRQVAQCDSG